MTELVAKSERKMRPEILTLENGRVQLEICTEGANLKSLTIDGQEIIFSPQPDNRKRGGMPVLGPTPGPVKNTDWKNLYPKMPSHGTDRRVVWKVDEANTNENKVVLGRFLGPGEFLFAGKIEMEFVLLGDGVRVIKRTTNFEDKPREVGHGLHPYFSTGGQNLTFDNEDVQSIHPLENGKSVILDNKDGNTHQEIVYVGRSVKVMLRADPEPHQWVFWSDDLAKYECIEPWWAGIGRGDVVGPGETKEYSLMIRKVDN